VVRARSLAPFFAFFLLSGLCSLVYQVVWLRLAKAQFGVTTPWVPGGDRETVAAFTRARAESFPYVRADPSVLVLQGHHGGVVA
jgi:hypothetical protein